MPISFSRPRLLFWALFIALLFADQLTKAWAQKVLTPFDSVTVIPSFLDLTYVRNTGVAFGMMTGHNLLLLVFALLLICGVFFWAARHLDWSQKEVNVLAALLLAGATGNILDRCRHGYVVDFIDFYLGNHHWPAFNVADSCICIGVGWIFFRQFLFSGQSRLSS